MTDVPLDTPAPRRFRPDRVWLLSLAIPLSVLVLDPPGAWPTVNGAAGSLLGTLPFILFAVVAIAFLKATGAEGLLAGAFRGREARMIVVAALAGGLSSFCSCEVIPFIAALLAAGTPLSAVMAFWLSSPLMDPAMFAITAGGISPEFALAKTAAAVALGAGGGFATMALSKRAVFADPLRARAPARCGCSPSPFGGRPVWRFWPDPDRRAAFLDAGRDNLLFLLKWLTFAYLIQMLLVRYVPAEAVGALLGGDGPRPVLLAALLGAPAYLNGYAAVPLVAGLMDQGMSPGAAMAFVIAGGVSCIPAAIAVWALVKPRVFAAYLAFALTGAALAGLIWNALSA